MRPAVFLDRDDTLMVATGLPTPPHPAKRGDVVDPSLVRLLPGAAEGCAALREAGLSLVVFSNQGVVARGGATVATVGAINRRLAEMMEASIGWERTRRGALIEAFYFCPYHPVGSVAGYTREHPWRKPAPGMILDAARDLGLDLARSWVVGDAPRDIQAGIAAGIAPERCLRIGAEERLASVADAAAVIVDRVKAGGMGTSL